MKLIIINFLNYLFIYFSWIRMFHQQQYLLVSEETFDKESVPLTASSSLTLRTTSDDEITTSEQKSLPPIEIQPKVF